MFLDLSHDVSISQESTRLLDLDMSMFDNTILPGERSKISWSLATTGQQNVHCNQKITKQATVSHQ